jgi:hypothetical protein
MAGKRKQRAPQSTLYSPTERAAEEERRQAARLPALAVYADLVCARRGPRSNYGGRCSLQGNHVSLFQEDELQAGAGARCGQRDG